MHTHPETLHSVQGDRVQSVIPSQPVPYFDTGAGMHRSPPHLDTRFREYDNFVGWLALCQHSDPVKEIMSLLHDAELTNTGRNSIFNVDTVNGGLT